MSRMFCAGARILFALTCVSSALSELQKVEITLDSGTSLNFSVSPDTGSKCKVCRRKLLNIPSCGPSQIFSTPGPVSVELECSKHQGAFNVEIARTIECTSTSCSGYINTNSNSDALLNLNRKFVWNLSTATANAAKIDFEKTGLKQIRPSQSCADHHIYTYEAVEDAGNVLLGRFCRTGPITQAQAQGFSRFSLELPAGKKLQNMSLKVSIGEEIKSLAKISVSLPQRPSSLELLPPNYPNSFPDDKTMEWCFMVPSKHQASVQVLNVTQPQCLEKVPGLEYHDRHRIGLVAGLTETQPVQNQGEFTMILRNCKTDRRRSNSPGMSMRFKVSSKTTAQVMCDVDLREYFGLCLHLKKLDTASNCIMRHRSVPIDQITLNADSITQLLFEDCQPEDIQVTGTKQLGCSRARSCPRLSLSVPLLPECLHKSLSNLTWALHLPKDGTAEMGCSSGTLMQELPGQPCNDSISIKVAEDDGTIIGTFCRGGPITKVQIHTNVSITVTGRNGEALVPSDILTARIKEEISESYIFKVSPVKDTPLLLATPGWPKGMKSYSTVSWIVTVPPKMEAHVMFTNLSQPKCSHGHTEMKIRKVGQSEDEYSRREDEKPQHEITVSGTFFLNMSNCIPEERHFRVFTKVTLHKSQKWMIIVIIVAALLVLFIAALIVVCLVIRKKKKNFNAETSIYNANGTGFLPGQNGCPQEDDESHVYDYIEDTLVYSHLLRSGEQTGIDGEADALNTTAAGTDSRNPVAAKESDTKDVGIYQGFLHQQKPELPRRPPSHMQQMVEHGLHEVGEGSSVVRPQVEP